LYYSLFTPIFTLWQASDKKVVANDHYRWKKHCNGLYQLPVAACNIFDGGGRYISVLGGSGLFHHPLDTWPEAVDLARISKWTRVFSGLGVALSR
jgi:hypothetical protein